MSECSPIRNFYLITHVFSQIIQNDRIGKVQEIQVKKRRNEEIDFLLITVDNTVLKVPKGLKDSQTKNITH